jgi:hypothetical protein
MIYSVTLSHLATIELIDILTCLELPLNFDKKLTNLQVTITPLFDMTI